MKAGPLIGFSRDMWKIKLNHPNLTLNLTINCGRSRGQKQVHIHIKIVRLSYKNFIYLYSTRRDHNRMIDYDYAPPDVISDSVPLVVIMIQYWLNDFTIKSLDECFTLSSASHRALPSCSITTSFFFRESVDTNE